MTLEELYAQIGGDFEGVMKRLRMEKLVAKFIVRFLDDPSCAAVVSAYEAGDDAALFEAAHAAKGVCANLALTRLEEPAARITEAVRPGNDELRASTDLGALVEELKVAYAEVEAGIREYAAAQ